MVPLTAPDAELLRAFTAGNEDALAAIYRTEYDGLTRMAREQLGEDLAHHAPRVAQATMLDAWAERARFETPSGLTAFLEQALTEHIAVQRRKHASLHRRGDTKGAKKAPAAAPSADEAVTQLLATLHAPAQSHEELLAEAKATKRAHATQHVQKVASKRSWVGPAILVGSLAAIAVLGIWYMDSRSEDIAVDKALKAEDARTRTTNRGQRGTITLNDDSEARMGADSRLRMPKAFDGTTLRTLQLTGLAHFKVSEGKVLPFKVRAGNVLVTATGTAFAVQAWEGDSAVMVAVTEGQVEVAVRDGKSKQTVTANNAVRVVGDNITAVDANALQLAMAWMRDSLVFVDAPVNTVLAEFKRWFDSHPTLAADTLGNRRVSLGIPLTSSGDALKMLADSAHLQIGFDKDEKVVLSDAPPAPPPPPARRGR